MPLVSIHSLPPSDVARIESLIVDVRDSGAAALRCSPSNIWVMFHALPPGQYVQGEGAPAMRLDASSHPPVVIIRAQAGRTREERTALVASVAAAVARGLGVPADNVWVHYQEMRSEDVWFGGHWSA
jgi:phenylpyruvate tautomerase PptA (4-oxalocrotonate tautomerase family)